MVCSLLGECWEEEEEYTERLFILGLVHHPLSHPHHTRLIIPHTLRHRRKVLLRTLGPRRVSEGSSSPHSLGPRGVSEKSSSPHTETDPTKVLPHTGRIRGKSAHTGSIGRNFAHLNLPLRGFPCPGEPSVAQCADPKLFEGLGFDSPLERRL